MLRARKIHQCLIEIKKGTLTKGECIKLYNLTGKELGAITREFSIAMKDIRQKWEKAEQLVINCNPKSVYALSEVDVLLEKYKDQHEREWHALSEDQNKIKKEFTNICVCKKK